MPDFDVVVWRDEIADGSIRYAAWCTAVAGVWGQGDTPKAALDDIAAAMAHIIGEPWDDGVSIIDAATAAAAMADLLHDLAGASIPYRMHRVAVPAPAMAGA